MSTAAAAWPGLQLHHQHFQMQGGSLHNGYGVLAKCLLQENGI